MRTDYIASDIHLGAVPRATERRFLRFLEHVGAHASSLLLAGDLFDFWFEYGRVIPGEHFRVLAALAELVEGGVPVRLLGGNHDAWGGDFLREQVGVEFHPGPLRTRLGGREALVVHGDGLGRGDLKYRALKTVLRSRAATAGFRLIHPELGLRIARAVSSTEGKGGSDEAARGRSAFLAEWARERLAEDASLELVVCGHAHLPATVEVEPGRWYVNAGDWLTHFSYVRMDEEGRPCLLRWQDGHA